MTRRYYITVALSIAWSGILCHACSTWAYLAVDFRAHWRDVAKTGVDYWPNYWGILSQAPWQGYAAFAGAWLIGLAIIAFWEPLREYATRFSD